MGVGDWMVDLMVDNPQMNELVDDGAWMVDLMVVNEC